MRTPKLDWSVPRFKEELLDLKYKQKKTLTEINFYLHEKYGHSFSIARLSQVFTGYSKEQKVLILEEIQSDAN